MGCRSCLPRRRVESRGVINGDEVGAIGQVLGFIAAFITLGYLTVQVGRPAEGDAVAPGWGRGELVSGMPDMDRAMLVVVRKQPEGWRIAVGQVTKPSV